MLSTSSGPRYLPPSKLVGAHIVHPASGTDVPPTTPLTAREALEFCGRVDFARPVVTDGRPLSEELGELVLIFHENNRTFSRVFTVLAGGIVADAETAGVYYRAALEVSILVEQLTALRIAGL